MEPNEIKSGIIITGPKWPEPVEVKKTEIFEQDIQIIGSMIPTGTHVDQILSFDELKNILCNILFCKLFETWTYIHVWGRK